MEDAAILAIRFLVLYLLVSLAAAALAQVHRSDSGLGGALILPYSTVANNNDTLLSIRNDGDEASAARVRLLDSEGGLIQSFNLYLDARAVATSAISMFDGSPGILPLEVGCMLSGSVVSVADSSSAIALDSMHRSIEVVEMASAASESALVESGRWADCGVLSDQFASGDWSEAPNTELVPLAQRLSASASVINVRAGIMNVVAATTLAGFSDIAQHTTPDSQSPDLSDAHDSQAPEAGTRSQVCTPEGCRIDEWKK